MKLIQWGLAGALIAALGASTAARAEEQQGQPKPSQSPQDEALHGKVESTEIGLGQTPPAVRSSIEKWAQGAQVKKVQEVRQGTKIQYKAEIERKGEKLEVLMNEQGQVLRSGKDVGLDEGIF